MSADDGFSPVFDFLTGDLSFISLTLVLPQVRDFLAPGGEAVLLVKPQFEVGKGRVGKGGIVRDDAARLGALAGVSQAAADAGLPVLATTRSPITGAKGNVEFLVHLRG